MLVSRYEPPCLPTGFGGKANRRFTCHLTLEFLHRSKELYIIQKVRADRSCKTKLEKANSMEY